MFLAVRLRMLARRSLLRVAEVCLAAARLKESGAAVKSSLRAGACLVASVLPLAHDSRQKYTFVTKKTDIDVSISARHSALADLQECYQEPTTSTTQDRIYKYNTCYGSRCISSSQSLEPGVSTPAAACSSAASARAATAPRRATPSPGSSASRPPGSIPSSGRGSRTGPAAGPSSPSV